MESQDDLVFQLEVVDAGDPLLVMVGGEFDAHASQSFDRAIDDLASSAPERVVIDLQGVSFIDSSGLRSLVRARKTLTASAMSLRNLQPGTVRLLEITGLTGEFQIA